MSSKENLPQKNKLLTWPGLILCCLLSAVLTLLSSRLSAPDAPATQPVAVQANILPSHILSIEGSRADKVKTLAKVAHTWELLAMHHPQKLPLAYQLIEANLHVGLNDQAVYINNRLVEDTTKAFSKYDPRTIEARQTLIDTLLSAGQSNTAYDLARQTLQQYLEQPPDNPMLLAIAYYQNAQVNLSCVYPRCDRPEAMSNGLKSTEIAIELLQQMPDRYPLLLADNLMLKNWFIRDRDTKVDLISQALNIYEKQLGAYNAQAAQAHIQLGQVYMHWDKDFAKAKASLEKGLGIFSALFGENNVDVQEIKRTLGSLHLDGGKFAQAINYTLAYLQPKTNTFECINAKCKLALLTLLKAQFYSGDVAAAELTATQLKKLSEDPKQAYSLSQDIAATLLRLTLHRNTQPVSLFDISNRLNLNETGGVTAKNNLAESVLTFELLHAQLMHYPHTLNGEKYLSILTGLVHGNTAGYIPGPEKTYLAKRAARDCNNVSESFCAQVDRALVAR